MKGPGSILVSSLGKGCEMEENERHKSDHEVFVSGMPPSPELILEDLPWREPFSGDPEEDRRLRQKQVATANSTYYRQVLVEYRKRCPSIWTRFLRWCRRLKFG